MNNSVNNFFDVTNPHEYSCRIGSYRVNHSLMLVRATRSGIEPEKTFYITFGGVLYFEGPLAWGGAGFYIGPQNECERVLQRMGYTDNLHILSDKYRLFKVNLSNLEVKIVALDAIKSADIPPNFPWLREENPFD